MTERKNLEAYPQVNLSHQLLQHQREMLQFLFFTNYDIIYQTFELKHGSYSDRNRGQLVQAFKSEEISKNYKIISDKLHLRIIRDDINLDKQLGKLQILWYNRNIPYFHRYYFCKYLYTAYMQSIPQKIEREEHLIKTEEHIYYSLFKSINAREACLRNLKKHLSQLQPQDVYEYLHVAKERMMNQRRKVEREKYKSQGYKLKLVEDTQEGKMSKTKFELFSDNFNHLTKLTLYVVELILKWKQYIATITHDAHKQKERMEYYFYDDNYLLKILTDLGFLRVSFLQQFYPFAPKNDPFLLQCVLGFESRPQKTIQQELLKLIFMPQKQSLADIMSKMQYLSQEYRYNIRSRKVFDPIVIKQSLIRADQKHFNNERREDISNIVLKKIQSPLMNKKSKSVNTFRINTKSQSNDKKQKIIIQFKKNESPLRKKLISLPGSIEKQVLQKQQNSPLKNSIILQKNEGYGNNPSVDVNLLNMLKKQVVRKVKQDFAGQYTTQHQNQALQLYIDNKVKETMRGIFPFEPQKQIKSDIVFTPVAIEEQNIGMQIELMFKRSIPEYREMQYNQTDLIKLIEQSQYAYFIVGRIEEQEIGRVVCTLQKGITEFKVLKIIYLHFEDLSEIQMLIMQIVQFLWKYQNSYEIHYNFFQPSNHEPIKLLIQGMEHQLQKQCIFGRKQLYSTVMEVKLIFKRLHKNINYIPNAYPLSLHLQFSLLFSHKKLMLENKNQQKHNQTLNYDYLLMQAIKRFLSAQEILTLKQKISWKSRLKMIMDMIREDEEIELMSDVIHQIQASNVSQLNNILTKIHQPFLQVSDLVKGNKISLLSMKLTLTPNYPVKSVYGDNHQQYYRIALRSRQTMLIDSEGTQFFSLQLKDQKKYQIVVFSAHKILNHAKSNESNLSTYLYERITKGEHGVNRVQRVIDHLYLPMNRFPHSYKERQEMFYHTSRVPELQIIKIDILLGEKLQWFCNMQMDNSVKFKKMQADIVLEHPYGVAIVAVPSNTIIYSRIFV